MSNIENFSKALADIDILIPREVKGKKIAQAVYTRQVVAIVGIKTTTSRFLPVSHAGYSNETYIDKVDLLGKTRAEFIGRKLKGIERRVHMNLFRKMLENKLSQQNSESSLTWQQYFNEKFGKTCIIPNGLCIACWNCSLFGGMEAGRGATFSRIRYFDTFSVEDAVDCIQTDDSPEQMAIGNTVGEDLSVERGEASFHRYEYVKAGTRFPFITIIESPTFLDIAGYIAAVKLADQHGYGKYSANNGKFETTFLAIANGYPLFSVLNMLTWIDKNDELESLKDNLKFDTTTEDAIVLLDEDIDQTSNKLNEEFGVYVDLLNKGIIPEGDKKGKGRK